MEETLLKTRFMSNSKFLLLLFVTLTAGFAFSQTPSVFKSKTLPQNCSLLLDTVLIQNNMSMRDIRLFNELKTSCTPITATDTMVELRIESFTLTLVSSKGLYKVTQLCVGNSVNPIFRALFDSVKTQPGDLLMISDIRADRGDGKHYLLSNQQVTLTD